MACLLLVMLVRFVSGRATEAICMRRSIELALFETRVALLNSVA